MVLKTNGSLMKVESIAEHSAKRLTCIEQKSALTIIFDLIFEWPLRAGLATVRVDNLVLQEYWVLTEGKMPLKPVLVA